MLRSRNSSQTQDIWPGFVDALSAVLMVLIFLVMIFVIAQLFLSETLSGRDKALDSLSSRVSALSDELGLQTNRADNLQAQLSIITGELEEKARTSDNLQLRLQDLHTQVAQLTNQQATLEAQRDELRANLSDTEQALVLSETTRTDMQAQADQLGQDLQQAQQQIEVDSGALALQVQQLQQLRNDIEDLQKLRQNLQDELLQSETLNAQYLKQNNDERKRFIQATAKTAALNAQIKSLHKQLAQLSTLLEVAEQRDAEANIQISALGQRLNKALASKVQELAKYRSEFFGRLRNVLGDRDDIKVVGDRFVFQSEVLFSSGAAALETSGIQDLQGLAATLLDISSEIPDQLNWILQIEGHTDRRPINTTQFPSNWELSTQRAISVVRALIELGVPAERLSAAGFGEFQPRDDADDEIAYHRNRRIEFKLTQR